MNQYKHNISFLCLSSSLGGLELSALNLAYKLRQRGSETILVVPPDSPLSKRAKALDQKFDTLKPVLKYGDILAAAKLARILKRNDIDRLIIMQSKDINIAAMAKMFYPSVALVYYQQMQSNIPKKDFLHTWVYSKLSLWIALTNRMKGETLNNTKVPESRIRVIPLGQDSLRFDPNLYNQGQEKEYFHLPKEILVVGMIGRLDRKKGQETFLRAIPEILKYNQNVLFVLVGEETRGEDGYKNKLMELCKKLKIENYVRFLPFTDEVPRFLAAIDVFVMPSDAETFGLVVIEAMAMEKPVIATNAGGVPELIHDGKDGLLISPRDSNALSAAVRKILDDFFLRQTLSTAAREKAVQNFDFEKCVDKIAESIHYM
jgi:D-inositol-3-phosphate glycosyltransferase